MKTFFSGLLTPARGLLVLLLAASLLTACVSGGPAPTAAQPAAQPAAPAQPATAQPVQPSPSPVPPTPVPAASPTLSAPTPTAPGDFAPLSQADCQQIQGTAAGALKVPFTLTVAPFVSPSGYKGAGCVIQAKGTAVDFKSLPDVMSSLQTAFKDWAPDIQQAADSPTAAIQGAWRGSQFLLTQAEWQPAPTANCPPDKPIAQCVLTAEQVLFTVTLTAAQSPNPPAAAVPVITAAPTVASAFVKDQMIRFETGPLNANLTGSVAAGSYDRYRLSLAAGENLDLRLSSPQGTAGFVLLDPNQQPMPGTESQRANWYSAEVRTPGEYRIIVGSMAGRADYNLAVKVTNAGAPLVSLPTAVPTLAPGAAYRALPAKECAQLQSQLQSALQMNLNLSESSFGMPAGDTGQACTLFAEGNGLTFGSVPQVMTAVRSVFGGWSEDLTLSADGPTGSEVGLRRGGDLALISVGWAPSPDANCPSDQPIATCSLTPEQQLYTVLIQVARK